MEKEKVLVAICDSEIESSSDYSTYNHYKMSFEAYKAIHWFIDTYEDGNFKLRMIQEDDIEELKI